MKKFLPFSLAVFVLFPGSLKAQPFPERSGNYQALTLGVDSSQGRLTGYYHEEIEYPNMPHLECSFYLSGNKQGNHYEIQAWSPGKKNSPSTTGSLSFFSVGQGNPVALLKLEKLSRDCTEIRPGLGKGQGAQLSMNKGGAWTEVRIVANPKASYYLNPNLASPTAGSAKRGTVLTVAERRSDWALMQSEQKTKGWLREEDLFPTSPTENTLGTTLALENSPASRASKVPPPSAVPNPPLPSSPTEAALKSPAEPKPESKGMLIDRLKTLSSRAFDLALQVQKNPSQRSALSGERTQMEQDLDALVSQLKQADPAAYTSQSEEIFQTYLDLQYVKQDQAVVSLRLNQKIRSLKKK